MRAEGLEVRRVQTGLAFRRLEVRGGAEVIEVDLVADPVAALADPLEVAPGLLVDTPHEILVNKLTALLGRVAVRDLYDVKALVEHGEDLDAALDDAPRKDGGFSPPTLAWLLDTFPVERLAADSGFDAPALARWRDHLVAHLLQD